MKGHLHILTWTFLNLSCFLGIKQDKTGCDQIVKCMQFLTKMCFKRKKIYNTLMKTNGDTLEKLGTICKLCSYPEKLETTRNYDCGKSP